MKKAGMNKDKVLEVTMRSWVSMAVFALILGLSLPSQVYGLNFPFRASGMVEHVHDGDTIYVKIEGVRRALKVRLWGINAPELKTSVFGETARDYLRELIQSQAVLIHCFQFDAYRRYVCQLFREGLDIQGQMVILGWARDLRNHSRGFYSRHQAEAQRLRLGIWSAH